MTAGAALPTIARFPLDAALADAVVLKWNDMMPKPASGLIHVEYHVGPRGPIEFLKVWASTTRGHWELVCEYFMCSGTSDQRGLHFANGYESEGLARSLDSILKHQEMFLVTLPSGADHMIQVLPPDQEDTFAANRMMDAFRERLAA